MAAAEPGWRVPDDTGVYTHWPPIVPLVRSSGRRTGRAENRRVDLIKQ